MTVNAEPDEENVLGYYNYYILGQIPIRIAFSEDKNPYVAEIPNYETGGLVIDNSYIFTVLMDAPDDLHQVNKKEFDKLLKTIQKAQKDRKER